VEEDFALTSKENKAKGKKSQGEEGGKKMDLKKSSVFIVMSMGTMPRIAHRRKQVRRS